MWVKIVFIERNIFPFKVMDFDKPTHILFQTPSEIIKINDLLSQGSSVDVF